MFQFSNKIEDIIRKICDADPLDIDDIHFLMYEATDEEKMLIFHKYNEIMVFIRSLVEEE
jgi:hypothetical protein